jgi:hypothetical protein
VPRFRKCESSTGWSSSARNRCFRSARHPSKSSWASASNRRNGSSSGVRSSAGGSYDRFTAILNVAAETIFGISMDKSSTCAMWLSAVKLRAHRASVALRAVLRDAEELA